MDPQHPVELLQSGASLTAVYVRLPKVAATTQAFAAWCEGEVGTGLKFPGLSRIYPVVRRDLELGVFIFPVYSLLGAFGSQELLRVSQPSNLGFRRGLEN